MCAWRFSWCWLQSLSTGTRFGRCLKPRANCKRRLAAQPPCKRDARGIPHIEASSWQDAIFLQGFVTAQDRLWQMDVLRRFGAGDLAEVFGPAACPPMRNLAACACALSPKADAAALRPSDRAVFVAYARGVNFFIDTHRGRLFARILAARSRLRSPRLECRRLHAGRPRHVSRSDRIPEI